MVKNSYSYSKLLWGRILAAMIAIAFLAWRVLEASMAYVPKELLAPEDYSTSFEILINCVALAFVVNYLIVCILRFKDYFTISDGVLECVVHKHVFFLLSRRHIRMDLSEIAEAKARHERIADLIDSGTRLRFRLRDGKWHGYSLFSIAMTSTEVYQLLADNGVRTISWTEKKWSNLKKTLVIVGSCCISCSILVPLILVHADLAKNSIMPISLILPFCVIGIIIGFSLRELFPIASIVCAFGGLCLGALFYLAAMAYNFYGADSSKAVVKEYRVGACYSVYHPASGTVRRRRPARTDYHLSICSMETGRTVKVYSLTHKQYKRARSAESVMMSVCRGALGYPVADMDNVVFKRREDGRAKLREVRDANMKERLDILREIKRLKKNARQNRERIDSLQNRLNKLRRDFKATLY